MAKSSPNGRRLTPLERERQKKLRAFKTALPLAITLVLLFVVYIFVLMPDSPHKALYSALLNSLDTTKQKSWRYDGSFKNDSTRVSAEYNGQKASNGDSDFYLKVGVKDKTATYRTIRANSGNYVYLSGVDAINGVLATIPGASQMDTTTTQVLSGLSNVWIKMTDDEASAVNKLLPCSEYTVALPTKAQLELLTSTAPPLEIIGKPSLANDGSQSRIYEVGLKESRTTTDYERGIVGYINCLDALRADDPTLREVNSQDTGSIRLKLTIDQLSNSLSKVTYSQYSQFFELHMRDYNKDVTVQPPESYTTLNDALKLLDQETLKEFQQKVQAGSL